MDDLLRSLRFGALPGHAPMAGGRFRFEVDFDAPDRWPDVAYDTALPAARHDSAGRSSTVAALQAAAQTMGLRVPAALHLVNDQLQRVLLRQSDVARGGSASHRGQVGRCLLTNLHQPGEAELVAIEALTHEAIHQLIYRIEAERGCFCDLAETPTFRSPWSGARLPLHSLVHAGFVWFGLLGLWTELALAPRSQGESLHARARVAHCLFGFAFLRDLVDDPAFPVARMDARVLASLRELADCARLGRRASEPVGTLRQLASVRQGDGWPSALAAGMARFDFSPGGFDEAWPNRPGAGRP